jgi:hypothetical protein
MAIQNRRADHRHDFGFNRLDSLATAAWRMIINTNEAKP